MVNTNIAALLENKEGCFSLQDSLVLAIPNAEETALIFHSPYSGKKVEVMGQSLFVFPSSDITSINKKGWFIHSMLLSEVIEVLAVIDTAMGQSFLAENEITSSDNKEDEVIHLSSDIFSEYSIKNIVIDLIIQRQPQFYSWCNILRRYEAYGIMRFLLSTAEKDKNANINQLCARYGVSASYFRQLYRENFNKTAKRKIMSVRMASAILKLIESDNSILDVGLEAGYCSASHFTNDIKKELGLTPSDIRHLGAKLYEQ
ncbi:helix-turn-helix domain-containing protein [Providencia stuartii]|uniref:helix-turn-helix domain-containing protein n=1 Tax=Providencia stuartii TaxID=588 RepID=UPI0013D7A9D0|nr:helix-turn-helix domain-containing protein [Providencia stuartii]